MSDIDDDNPEFEEIETDAELLQLVATVHQSTDQKKANSAKQRLKNNLYPQLVRRLIKIILHPSTSHETRVAITRMMGRFSEVISDKCQGGSQNIHLLLDYILSDIEQGARELLQQLYSQFLEGQIFGDFTTLQQVFEVRTQKLEASFEDLNRLESFIFIYQSLKEGGNSYALSYAQRRIIDAIPKFAREISKRSEGLAPQQMVKKKKEISARMKKLLEFVNQQVESRTYGSNCKGQTYEEYLLLFSSNGSIIAHIPPCPLSQVSQLRQMSLLKCTSEVCDFSLEAKGNIIESIQNDSSWREYPQEVFTLMIRTLLQFNQIAQRQSVRSIMNRCLKIIEVSQLALKETISTRQQKTELLSALLLLFTSTETEIAEIEKNPQNFVRETDACLQPLQQMQHSTRLKPAVLCFIKNCIRVFGSKFSIIDDILALLTDVLHPSEPGLMEGQKPSIRLYTRCAFYHLSREKKLECLLLFIPALYNLDLANDQTVIQKINYFIEANFDTLLYYDSPIVTLRFIRTLYYFYSPARFEGVQMQMDRGKAFTLEAIKLLIRYVRINKSQFNLIFFILTHFEQIINQLHIQNNWFDFLVSSLHEEILLSNYQTNLVLVRRIKRQFVKQESFMSEHKNKCIDMLKGLIAKETDQTVRSLLLQTSFQFYGAISADKNLSKRYQQKLIDLCANIIQKCTTVPSPIKELAIRSLTSLRSRLGLSSKLFNFYNAYFAKNALSLEEASIFYEKFLEEIQYKLPPNRPMKNAPNFEVVINFAFLMTQIVGIHPDACLRNKGLLTLFYLTKHAPYAQKQCLLGIIMTYAYMQPEQFVQFLNCNYICKAYLKHILRIDMNEKFFVKIFNLASLKLLDTNQEFIFSQDTVAKLISNIKELAFKVNPRGKNGKVRSRKLLFAHSNASSKRKEVSLNDYFTKYKHPLQEMNELEEFKHLYAMRSYLIDRKISEKQARELKLMLHLGVYGEGIEQIQEEDDEE